MAQLDKKSIKSLTQLSRIKCTEEEEDALLKDLQKIVTYVEQLAEVDTTDVLPCAHILEDMSNVFREDAIGECLPREVFLANAPSQVGGLVKVPPVIKQQ